MQGLSRERGATLLDVIVGSALMMIVFVGIAGAFQLAITAVGGNSSRAGAIALANERLEYIRSLPYDAIGTEGGVPAGDLEQEEQITLNSFIYTRRTFVSYEDDPADGTGAADTNGITTDYKAIKTSVSWTLRQGMRTVTMVGRISPPSIETAVPGGTLVIQVTNDADQPVANAEVEIVNDTTAPQIDMTTFTDADGLATVLGAPPGANYEIAVTKAGYTIAGTYDADTTNTNPIPAHLSVALNQTTLSTFEIDLVSSLTVQTVEPIEEATWKDEFDSATLLSSQNETEVSGGSLLLLEDAETGYPAIGTGISVSVSPNLLFGWNEFSWDETKSAATNILYRAYTGTSALVPDADLPGNSAGFTVSPVSLAGLSTTTYPSLRFGAELSTTDASTTPEVSSWEVSYDVGPVPIEDVPFTLRGVKTIGAGPGGPVYKYNVNHDSGSGILTIGDFEYDTYTMTVLAASGYDISSSCPSQPVFILPNSSGSTVLFLSPHTANSLLLDVRGAGNAPIAGASVRLQRSGYDTTVTSDACGYAFFSGISASGATPYSLDVSAAGYQPYSSTEVEVDGTTQLQVILNN